MKTSTPPLAAVLLVLMLSLLACNLPWVAGPPAPADIVEPSVDALESFNDKWRSLVMSTPAGPFSLTFDEGELTSAVAEALAQAQRDGEPPIPLHDVQVSLHDGSIEVFGRANLDALTVNGQITLVPSVSDTGQVAVAVQQVTFGSLQIEDATLVELSRLVEHTINQPMQVSPVVITLQTITVTEGQLTLSGTLAE